MAGADLSLSPGGSGVLFELALCSARANKGIPSAEDFRRFMAAGINGSLVQWEIDEFLKQEQMMIRSQERYLREYAKEPVSLITQNERCWIKSMASKYGGGSDG